jgi:hypothetical protein
VVEATDAGTDGADGRIAARMRHETTWEGNGVWDRYPALYHKSEKDFNGSLDLSVECVCVCICYRCPGDGKAMGLEVELRPMLSLVPLVLGTPEVSHVLVRAAHEPAKAN